MIDELGAALRYNAFTVLSAKRAGLLRAVAPGAKGLKRSLNVTPQPPLCLCA